MKHLLLLLLTIQLAQAATTFSLSGNATISGNVAINGTPAADTMIQTRRSGASATPISAARASAITATS